MANEIHELVSVACVRSDGFRWSAVHDARTDQTDTTPNEDSRRITLTTADTALTFQNVSATGIILVTNLEPKGGNFVKYGPNNGGSMLLFGQINPQETHKIRLGAAVSMRWQANLANVDLQLEVLED